MITRIHRVFLVSSLATIISSSSSFGATWYVDDSHTSGTIDGTSWNNAFQYLQDALDASTSGDTIKVAQGSYFPDDDGGFNSPAHTADSRSESFKPKAGVELFGGYIGYDDANPETRDPASYVTILSGDLTQNDTANFGNYSENAYHVVDLSISNDVTELDGVTITGGNANGGTMSSDSRRFGAGIFDPPTGGFTGAALIADCIITENFASSRGGGVYVFNAGNAATSIRFQGCTITGNRCDQRGAGCYNSGSFLAFADCTISGNVWSGGGGR